jgi:two-component sensor histidine kinase
MEHFMGLPGIFMSKVIQWRSDDNVNHSASMEDLLDDPKNGHLLTRAIIDTIREPLLVLNKDLCVLVASPSFYTAFKVLPSDTVGKHVYSLGNGQWDIPALRGLLSGVLPNDVTMDAFEVEHDFPTIGKRVMLLNSREILYENDQRKSLLTIYDVTDQRALEADKEHLMRQKDLLIKEMRHRIANSLQLIASVLLLKAGLVESEETRKHLEDAHERIMSIAAVQKQLDPVEMGEEIKVGPYLEALCTSLARSMIGGRKPITIQVHAGKGSVSSDTAISFGLITTELVINAIKHAFPDERAGIIIVSYEEDGRAWTLSIADDGIGKSTDNANGRDGLGTSIVAALANQLGAKIHMESSATGTKVTFHHTGPVLESYSSVTIS